MILYDQDFNPHNDAQAEDRAHRVGQSREVVVHRLVTRHTIEEQMYTCAQRKLELDKKMQQRQQQNQHHQSSTVIEVPDDDENSQKPNKKAAKSAPEKEGEEAVDGNHKSRLSVQNFG